jgi:hypothetical protein
MLRGESDQNDSTGAAMSGFTFTASDNPAASGPVYHDRHETSLPLLLLGAVTTVSMAAQLGWSGGNIGLFGDLWTAAALASGFAVLWLTFLRRAARAGMRRPPGFGLATIIGLVFIVSPLAVVLVYAGPFVVLGSGLLAAGVKLRNRFLTAWAVVIGAIGVFEGFFGITNRLPMSVWADWEHPAIYLALGILTLAAGIVMRMRENKAATAGPG